MEYTSLQNNFSSGVVDPLLQGQVNTQLYANGLKKCINFFPDPRGYLFRRPGTRYADLSILGSRCRVRTLRTPDGPLVIIFADKVIYIFSQTIKLLFTLESPYAIEDLAELNIAEFESKLYLVHEDYPPYVLGSSSTTGFTSRIEPVGLASYKAMTEYDKEMNEDSIYLSGEWTCKKVEFIGDMLFDKKRQYPSCQTFKGGRWYLSGLRQNPTTIYASRSPDSKGNYRFNDFTMSEDYLLSTEQSLVKTTLYEAPGSTQIKDVQYSANSNSSSIKYDPTEPIPKDEATSTTVLYKADDSVTTLESERVKKVETTETKTYAVKPNVLPDHAIELTETDAYGSRINWLFTQQRVLAGTKRAVWMDSGAIATPETFDMQNTVSCSSSEIQPVAYSNMVMFASADKRNVNALFFDLNSGGYRLMSISESARFLFTSNIVSMVMMEGKLNLLWVLLEDGRLLSCTISGTSFGWAEQAIGGEAEIKDIAVYHAENEADLLYLIVDRGHDSEEGVPILYLETLEVEDLMLTEHFNLLDGAIEGKAATGTNSVDLSNLEMHEFIDGDVLQMSADTWVKPSFEYHPGLIEIEVPNARHVYVGFPIESEAEFLMQEMPTSNALTSFGKKRKAIEAILQVYRTGGGTMGFMTERTLGFKGDGKIGFISEGISVVEEFQRLMRMGESIKEGDPMLFSGFVRLPVSSYTSADVHAVARIDIPLPLTILALQVKYSIQEV